MTKEHTIPETEDQITEEDLDLAVIVNIDFDIGDHVVYPHHGAGKVLKKEVKKMFGEEREYLTIKILHNDMTV
ncbi:MAG: CarD family transcriptional regulator, partial [Solirubrobacterales bacterium]|nr:CarD family transcriptional regulator [Solirubrobacterales bacterium]